jgi:glyoxylase-like metal-dependent hydrolase (beta-lactamase superfamily II)
MKKFICMSLICLMGAVGLGAQESAAKTDIAFREIGSNLYLLPLYSVNIIACAGEEGVLLVDAGFEQTAEVLLAALEKLGHEQVDYIINTHWHFDHTGGNKSLGATATILAHENVRTLLSRDETILGQPQKAYPGHARPRITIHEPATLHINGQQIDIIPLTGGHTDGDVLVHFKKENIVHVGDIIFSDMFPFIDVDHGGGVVRLAENLENLMRMFPAETRILPGHGREYSMEDVKKYRRMILSTTDIVRKEMARQKSVEAMIDSEILKDWQSWEGSFSCGDWIRMVAAGIEPE